MRWRDQGCNAAARRLDTVTCRLHMIRQCQDTLLDVICQLAQEDVRAPCDMIGLGLDDIESSSAWSPEVRSFVHGLTQQVRSWSLRRVGRNMLIACQVHRTMQDGPSRQQTARSDSRKMCIEHVASLSSAQTTLLHIRNARPLDALELLARNLPKDPQRRKEWTAHARVAAVMGSCPRSLASFKSGLKHWLRYIEIVHGRDDMDSAAFPPSLDDVLAWSNTFRCAPLCML